MADTAQHLESEIEAHRAGVEETLDKLKQRFSVDQVVEDVGQFLGVENVRDTLHAAGQQVRENPMALALIGAGVAWLMMGRGPSASAHDDRWRGESDTGYGGRSGDRWQPYAGGHDRVRDADGGLTGKAMASVSELGESLGEVPGKVRDAMGKAADGMHASVETARARVGTTVRPLTDTVTAQPLLVGAATLAIGAILGSALPRSRTEDRYLSAPRDRMWDAASQATSEIGSRVADAAQATYQAATKAAREEGLLPDGTGATLAERVEHVAKAAFDTAAGQVEPVLHGDQAADDAKTQRSSAGSGTAEPHGHKAKGAQG